MSATDTLLTVGKGVARTGGVYYGLGTLWGLRELYVNPPVALTDNRYNRASVVMDQLHPELLVVGPRLMNRDIARAASALAEHGRRLRAEQQPSIELQQQFGGSE